MESAEQTLSTDEREALVTRAIQRQVAFLETAGVTFWRERVARAGVTPRSSLAEFRRLPLLTKTEMRELAPFDLVPAASKRELRSCYGTSGTTGAPVAIFWTRADFEALTRTVAAMLTPSRIAGEILALDGYHQGHLAAQAYDGALALLGGFSIPRHYLANDAESTLAQIRAFRCNTLVLGQRSGAAKTGVAVEDLLAADPRFFERLGVQWWIGSTSTFSPDVREHVEAQGVTVTNLYGSSEFGLMAFSCPDDGRHFHLGLGHVYVEIVDGEGQPVASGERGRVVASRLASAAPDGTPGPHTGTQLLRFDNGDEATLTNGPCRCGRTSPRISDIARSGDHPGRRP